MLPGLSRTLDDPLTVNERITGGPPTNRLGTRPSAFAGRHGGQGSAGIPPAPDTASTIDWPKITPLGPNASPSTLWNMPAAPTSSVWAPRGSDGAGPSVTMKPTQPIPTSSGATTTISVSDQPARRPRPVTGWAWVQRPFALGNITDV